MKTLLTVLFSIFLVSCVDSVKECHKVVASICQTPFGPCMMSLDDGSVGKSMENDYIIEGDIVCELYQTMFNSGFLKGPHYYRRCSCPKG